MNDTLNKLNNVYKTLLEINTKGQDTVYMGSCIVTLQEVINDMQRNIITEKGKQIGG